MAASRGKTGAPPPGVKARPPELLRKLIGVAMDFERRTMQLYCQYESMFPEPAEVRGFWFDMAEHESRHYGALAMVASLLDSAPQRTLPAAPALTRAHVERLRDLLERAETEARHGVTLTRAFETALAIESSEIEDLVLDLLSVLKGEHERERAVQILIHDLGDLSYMIERFSSNRTLLARVDKLIEQRVGRLRGAAAATSRRAPAGAEPVRAGRGPRAAGSGAPGRAGRR
jgi:rubrerythrin